MYEYEFKVGNVWLATYATSLKAAVAACNRDLEGDDEPREFSGSGSIFRVQLDIEKVTEKDIYYTDAPADPIVKENIDELTGQITDGFGNTWSSKCHCGGNMSVVRPGKVQCDKCG